MKIEVGRLKDDPGEAESFDFSFEPSEGVDGCIALTKVHVAGAVTYGGNEFLLTGSLSARVQLLCRRCLAPVEKDVLMEFSEEIDEEEASGEDPVVDVEDVATQLWVTAIPMQVLCREDCKGLCPICGKDLNEGGCDCPQDDADPRLEVLRGLLDT